MRRRRRRRRRRKVRTWQIISCQSGVLTHTQTQP
jgi:hypothetical protein